MNDETRRDRMQYVPLSAFILLNNACIPVYEAFDSHPYQVGSSLARADWRDVDVRTILPDYEFDVLFSRRGHLWSLVCLSTSEYLSRVSGLPIDFQVQRMTDANAQYPGPRNALGFSARPYAGGIPDAPLAPTGEVDGG